MAARLNLKPLVAISDESGGRNGRDALNGQSRRDEGSARPEKEPLSRARGSEQRLYSDIHVFLGSGIQNNHWFPGGVAGRLEQLFQNCVRTADTDRLQAYGRHILPFDRSLALFHHVVSQVGALIPKSRIFSERRLRRGQEPGPLLDVMHIVNRVSTALEEEWTENYGICLAEHRLCSLSLQWEMASQGRVAPQNDFKVDPGLLTGGLEVLAYFSDERPRLGRVQGAGVGEDEEA
ncbi:unnamed protein product [Clonostachys byssicola]|uniref:Uncharacterized protein n=1 Tax=Clonostachys byssicola TaxID=160290 RepID=A0A9N9UH24_9HYPO|nr:unnamed protein product [Clonostachys byssicola]